MITMIVSYCCFERMSHQYSGRVGSAITSCSGCNYSNVCAIDTAIIIDARHKTQRYSKLNNLLYGHLEYKTTTVLL